LELHHPPSHSVSNKVVTAKPPRVAANGHV
jgi:hypothetical protein